MEETNNFYASCTDIKQFSSRLTLGSDPGGIISLRLSVQRLTWDFSQVSSTETLLLQILICHVNFFNVCVIEFQPSLWWGAVCELLRSLRQGVRLRNKFQTLFICLRISGLYEIRQKNHFHFTVTAFNVNY